MSFHSCGIWKSLSTGTVSPIFSNFFYCSSHQFFDILQQNGCSKNPKASPLLHFSALCDLPETSKKFDKKFGIFFSIFSFLRAFVVSSCRRSGFRFRVFLSLRYGADLGRSRLVSFLSVLSRLCHALLVSWSAFNEVRFFCTCKVAVAVKAKRAIACSMSKFWISNFHQFLQHVPIIIVCI